MFQNADTLINEAIPAPARLGLQSIKCQTLGVTQEEIDKSVFTTVRFGFDDFTEYDRRYRLPKLLLINSNKYENDQGLVKDIAPVVFVLEPSRRTIGCRFMAQLTPDAQDRLRALFLDNYLVLRAYIRANGRALGIYNTQYAVSRHHADDLLGGTLLCDNFYVVNMFILGQPYANRYARGTSERANGLFRKNSVLSEIIREAVKTIKTYDMEQAYGH